MTFEIGNILEALSLELVLADANDPDSLKACIPLLKKIHDRSKSTGSDELAEDASRLARLLQGLIRNKFANREQVLKSVESNVSEMKTLHELLISRNQPNEPGRTGKETTISKTTAKTTEGEVSDTGPRKTDSVSKEGTVCIELNRLDRLMDTIGELAIADAMVTQSLGESSNMPKGVGSAVKLLNKTTIDLQNRGLGLCLTTLSDLFTHIEEEVTAFSAALGKTIELTVKGQAVELDKKLADSLKAPLGQIVKNSIEKGIETETVRIGAGKPAAGHLFLEAFHRGTDFFIRFQDDGCGIDPETQGNGSGLAGARQALSELNGTMEISCEPGAGNRFLIKLPMTKSIMDGMVVRVGEQRFVLPTLSVVTFLRPAADMISTVFKKGECLRIHENLIPLVRLSRAFDISGGLEDPCEAIVVVVENAGVKAAILIDGIVSKLSIVRKELDAGMQKIQGISGGTITPDGRVCLILDVGEIVSTANEKE